MIVAGIFFFSCTVAGKKENQMPVSRRSEFSIEGFLIRQANIFFKAQRNAS